MTGDVAARPASQANGDTSALAVWIACGALYALLITLVFVNPAILRGELGLVELGQTAILGVALIFMIDVAVRANTKWLRVWMGFVTLGTIYLLGEETSWGQHFFGWEMGDGFFARFNDQGETNFHNSGDGWLDQKPRALLLIGMIVGTIVHPLVKWARKGRGLFDNPWWFAPTLASLAPVVISQIAALPKKIESLHVLPYSLNLYRWSEMEEIFMYIFFITYALSLRQRLIWRKRQGVTG